MVRKQLKDSKVDTELVYAYAKTHQLGPLEEFISGTHFANLQSAGDRCAPPPCRRRPSICGIVTQLIISRVARGFSQNSLEAHVVA